jgi:hypothetical protein
MTAQQAIEKLNALGGDPEADHSQADDILLEFIKTNGGEEVEKAWQEACRRCGFWYA